MVDGGIAHRDHVHQLVDGQRKLGVKFRHDFIDRLNQPGLQDAPVFPAPVGKSDPADNIFTVANLRVHYASPCQGCPAAKIDEI